jgi:hypothetical protein
MDVYLRHHVEAGSANNQLLVRRQKIGPSSPPSNDESKNSWSFVSNLAKPSRNVAISTLDFNTICYFVNAGNSSLQVYALLQYYEAQC